MLWMKTGVVYSVLLSRYVDINFKRLNIHIKTGLHYCKPVLNLTIYQKYILNKF